MSDLLLDGKWVRICPECETIHEERRVLDYIPQTICYACLGLHKSGPMVELVTIWPTEESDA